MSDMAGFSRSPPSPPQMSKGFRPGTVAVGDGAAGEGFIIGGEE
jgi:hypothetical protein